MEQENTQAIAQENHGSPMDYAIKFFNPRILAASIASPLIPGLLIFLYTRIVPQWGEGLILFITAICAVSYVGFFALGLPGVFLLHKRGKLTTMNLSAYGSATGSLFYTGIALFLSFMDSPDPFIVYVIHLFTGMLCGGFIAFFFGVIGGIKMR